MTHFKKSRRLGWALAFLVLTAPGFSGAGPLYYSSDPDVTLAHLPDKILSDFPQALDSPNGWIALGGGGLAAADGFIFDPSNPWPSGLRNLQVPGVWDFGNFYGQGWVEGFGGVGAWAFGGLTGDLRLAEFGRDASQSLLLATILVTGLKYTFPRERPDHTDNLSFPSGHTITAFCVAPVIAKYGGDELGIPAYLLAAVTGLSRVEGEHHYLSDVLVGATLGVILGNMALEKPGDLSLGAGPGGLSAVLAFN